MQKVIIPALALLIGMALGALLMRNSQLTTSDLPSTEQNDQSVTAESQKTEGNASAKVATMNIDPDTEPIKISLGESMFDKYLTDPILTAINSSNPCTEPNNILFGWSVDMSKIEEIKKKYEGKMTRFSLLLGRLPDNQLTLIIVPENDDNELLLADDMILEYVRPCPPRCKNKVHFYELDPTTQKLELKSTVDYGQGKPCMKNPFRK